MLNEQIDFSEIEQMSSVALESGDLNKLQNILQPLLKADDKTRSASENLFVYRTLGQMYTEQGQHSQALEAFTQASSYDIRDLISLTPIVEEELKKAPEKVNTKLLMDLLIFHRDSLKNNLVMKIFKTIGDAHLNSGEVNRAREFYEKALDVRPGDMDLIQALLKASEASKDEQEILKSREKLLNTLTAPESRAAVLVSIGDDYLNNAKDEKRAIEAYEEALAECADSTVALQRILIIAERSEDWERALNALSDLVKSVTEDDEKCKYLVKMAWIFDKKLNNTKRTIQIFNEILDIQPGQLEVFQEIISLLSAQKDYAGIESNIEAMINRQLKVKPANNKLIARLCVNLGDFRIRQLNDIKGAAKAYKQVSDIYPEKVNYHTILAKLYAMSDDTLEDAIHENREILRLAPDQLDAVSELAKCYRKLEKYDEALCIYRVLEVLGMNNDEGHAIIQKFASDSLPLITSLSEKDLAMIRPNTLDMDLVNLIRETTMLIHNAFDNELNTYGFNPKDAKINLGEPTVFSSILKNAVKLLGIPNLPEVYRCEKFSGIVNPYFTNPSLLVSPQMLQGRRESELSFAITKSLMQLKPEFYLLQLGLNTIEQIVMMVFKFFRPNLNIPLNKGQQQLLLLLESNIRNDESAFNRLQAAVQALAKRGGNLNTVLFMESVEDFFNRLGLLLCDDISVIAKLLSEEARAISSRSVRDRIASLLVWAMSEDYIALRKKLGIAIHLS